jgi:putative SOS response-associated peptidase YedK
MCGRDLLTTPVDALAQLFRFGERPNLSPRYNIAPTRDVLRGLGPGAAPRA